MPVPRTWAKCHYRPRLDPVMNSLYKRVISEAWLPTNKRVVWNL